MPADSQNIPEISTLDLGRNWHELERVGGESFRWVNNAAELVFHPADLRKTMHLEIEPGPSIPALPLALVIRDGLWRDMQSYEIGRRSFITFELAQLPLAQPRLFLFAMNGGQAVARDARILNFRVFRILCSDCAENIVDPQYGITLGSQWYPVEHFESQIFRWMPDEAELLIPAALAGHYVRLDLEPGCGAQRLPLLVRLRDGAGAEVKCWRISQRQTVSFRPRNGMPSPCGYRLVVLNGGLQVSSDPRILNLRVFRITVE